MSGLMFGGRFLMFLFVVGIIALVVWAVIRASEQPARTNPPVETPLEIAKRRYARGEITREEFEDMKRDLE